MRDLLEFYNNSRSITKLCIYVFCFISLIITFKYYVINTQTIIAVFIFRRKCKDYCSFSIFVRQTDKLRFCKRSNSK